MNLRLLTLMSLFLLFGCAKELESSKTKIQIRMPAAAKKSTLKYYRAESSGSRRAKLSNLDDVDCYIVFVGWANGTGQCNSDASGTSVNVISNIHLAYGSVAPGGVIELDVVSGLARTFYIAGMTDSSGTCPDIITYAPMQTISVPTVVGSVTSDIQGESMELNINLSLDANSPTFNDCKGGPFNWEEEILAVWDQSNWDAASWGP